MADIIIDYFAKTAFRKSTHHHNVDQVDPTEEEV